MDRERLENLFEKLGASTGWHYNTMMIGLRSASLRMLP
jgi:hypothetical protein